jgi:hypothetical protein
MGKCANMQMGRWASGQICELENGQSFIVILLAGS